MPKNQNTLAVESLEARLSERFDRIENMFLAAVSGLPPFDADAEAAAVEAAAAAEAEAAEVAKAEAKAARAEAKAAAAQTEVV